MELNIRPKSRLMPATTGRRSANLAVQLAGNLRQQCIMYLPFDQRELGTAASRSNEFTLNRFDSSLYVSSKSFRVVSKSNKSDTGYERCRTFTGLSKRSEIAEFSESDSIFWSWAGLRRWFSFRSWSLRSGSLPKFLLLLCSILMANEIASGSFSTP
jgi:hypothetical protein